MSTAILSKGEPTLYWPSRPSPWSLDRYTDCTLLAPVVDVLSTTNPVKSLPKFRTRFVNSKMNTAAPIVHFLILMPGTTNWFVSHPDYPKLA